MIFCWDRVSCDETIVAGVDFIDRRPSGGHYHIICKGKGASGRLQRRQLFWIIDLIVGGHGEEFKF
jgi:hypothetical protein